ncbi:MAG: hypothetical protein WCF84_02665 [Anaerolineae bacterium]
MPISAFAKPDLPLAVRIAFDELDLQQLTIFARHSPARRLAMMFDLCDFARSLVVAYERQNHPDQSEQELWRSVRARIELSYVP